MTDAGRFPNLVERALRYLADRADASETDLCAHLFGATGVGPWSRLLARVLGADERLVRRPDGRWALRAREAAAPAHPRAAEFVAIGVVAAGPKPWRHPLLGVAALRFRPDDPAGAVVWQAVVNPGRPLRLPDHVVARGISEEDVATASAVAAIAPELLAFIGDRPLVGLDVGIAVAYLQGALRVVGLAPLTNELIDIVPLARLALGEAAPRGKPDATRLAAALAVPPPEERRLDSDARAAARLAAALIARLPDDVVTLPDLLAALARLESAAPAAGLDATRRRVLLDAALAAGIPSGPGVYLFRDESSRVLYVGKATSLRQRLTSYLTTDVGRARRMPGLVEATDEVETRPTATELEARILEARLIAERAPRYNTQVRAGVELACLRRNPAASAPRAKGDPRRPAWAALSLGHVPEVEAVRSPSPVADPRERGRPDGESAAGDTLDVGEAGALVSSRAEEREAGPRARSVEVGTIGPLATDEARRLLRDATDRYRLSGGKRDAAWAERADVAWSDLAAAFGATTAAGSLVADDLALFAVLGPWPPSVESPDVEEVPPLDFPLPTWGRRDGRAGSALGAPIGEQTDEPGGFGADQLAIESWPDDVDDWTGINQDWRAEALERAAATEPDEPSVPTAMGPLWLLDGAVRAVVCGRGGYLGGLTILAAATTESVAADLAALVARDAPSPTALAELGVALAEAERRTLAGLGGTTLALGGDLAGAASRLLAARDRLAGLAGSSTA